MPRILIVDDEEALMKALTDTLKDHGYDTAGYTRAADALEALRQQKFHVLVSDLMMPGMDGIATLRAALQIDPEIIGIIMTGAGTISTAVEAMKTGAFDYVLKPFKLNIMLPVLARAVALRDLRLKNAALEEKIRQRNIQLEVVNKELEAFAYTVSHDLRAPVRHIGGYAKFLSESDGAKLSEKGQEFLGRITSSATRMAQLIDDLLAFSRMGLSEMKLMTIDTGALVDEIVRQTQADLEGQNVVWKRGPLPAISADLNLMRQVFVNLISNAVKYSRMRNPAEIEIDCQTDGPDEVVICIRDNGAGFDMKYVEKLFGVFQRLHRQEEFEGTGVGLANVRRIVARHGGRTWAEGKINEGATFYITLPKKSTEAAV